jgi:hypothetical protein
MRFAQDDESVTELAEDESVRELAQHNGCNLI